MTQSRARSDGLLAHLRGPAAGEKLFDKTLVSTGLVEEIALTTVAVSANGAPVYAGAAAYPLPAERRPHVKDYSFLVERDAVGRAIS